MSSDLSTMSANLATMASALVSINSTLTSMALTNPASTDPSPAQSEGSKPTSIEKVYVLIQDVGTVNSHGDKDPANEIRDTLDNIMGIYLSREMGKDAGRRLLREQVDRRLDDFSQTDDERQRLREEWCMPENEYWRTWETGWSDSVGESSATGENQTYTHLRLVEMSVEAASVEVSSDDGKSKGEDNSERGSNRSMGEEH